MGKLIFVSREHYEQELSFLEKILSTGDIFIDVGANYGIYSAVASALVGEKGIVVSFEPATETFSVLKRNVDMNGSANVFLFRMALGDRRSWARLYHHADPGCNSLGKGRGLEREFEEVTVERLDDLLDPNTSCRVKAMKIDVEGAEELVLRGAEQLLRSAYPVVIFEMIPEHAARLGLAPSGARAFLRELGYDFFSLDESGSLRPVSDPPCSGNVIAIYQHTVR